MSRTLAEMHAEGSARGGTRPSSSIATFRCALGRRAPALATGSLGAEIATEVETVLSALDAARDPVGVREAMALVGLLGRRVACLGTTAFDLVAIAEALLETCGDRFDEAERGAVLAVLLDGFCRSGLEREREMQRDVRVRTSEPFEIAPRCVGLVLQGPADFEWIEPVVDALGPVLLRADARSVLALVRLEGEPDDDVVRVLASVATTATLVGAAAVFSVPAAWAGPLTEKIGSAARVFSDDPPAAWAEALARTRMLSVRERVANVLRWLRPRFSLR